MANIKHKTFRAIGLMSGTSLDGVDVLCTDFSYENDTWQYHILAAKTYPYSEMWLARLQHLPTESALNFAKTHAFYGRYLGQLVQTFLKETDLHADFVASHGHTVFHQPSNGFTTQIGDGAALSAVCGLPVVCDFRSMDVALGGQGAPLVPVGDALLFAQYDACLNLGGFSNISFKGSENRIAFDISPCNLILNKVALELGFPYDNKGFLAKSGTPDKELVQTLNNIEFYLQKGAKSLGIEWLNQHFWPIITTRNELSKVDLLASFTEHISDQISQTINEFNLDNEDSVLLTGGGAFNEFLVQQIQEKVAAKLIIPSEELVQFKEALIFAFLGVLRMSNEVNVLKAVTGSRKNHIGGAIYGNFNLLEQ
ncbi:MAG: anhydro-N-acetylmuramic acid kinase [Bacteroidia bacterium]|nr:anhydro-N-acetylmuramic acid kinase [Bacteroidia bacterium]